VLAKADSVFGNFQIYSDTSSFVLTPGDSVVFTTVVAFPPGAFKLGNNVVVVWPSKINGAIDFIADTTINQTYYVGVSGVKENTKPNLIIYPNPFEQTVTLEYDFDEQIQFTIYDLAGRMILQNPLHENTLDLSFLKEGIYFMELRNQNKIISRSKMIKL
jgi:hypothetical protein